MGVLIHSGKRLHPVAQTIPNNSIVQQHSMNTFSVPVIAAMYRSIPALTRIEPLRGTMAAVSSRGGK